MWCPVDVALSTPTGRTGRVRRGSDARDVIAIAASRITAESIGLLVVAVVVLLAALTVRRRILQRRWPSFQASVRTTPKPLGRGWALGIGCYDGDRLRWYRLLSSRMRPEVVLDRRTLQITGSRRPTGPEARALLAGHVVLAVAGGARVVELGVSDATRTHLTAWIETATRNGESSLGTQPVNAGWPQAATARPVPPRRR